MLSCAAMLAQISGVTPVALFETYLAGWTGFSVLALLCWTFVEIVRMARLGIDRPMETLLDLLRSKLPMIFLPAIVFPLFLGGYTWAKCSIPFVVGYPWESFWADFERALLGGHDAWRVAHALIPQGAAPIWSFFYAIVWGFALAVSGCAIFAFGNRRQTAIFFSSLMLCWLIGGTILAYFLSAAGPAFAPSVDASLSPRFGPLREELAFVLGEDDVVISTQRYLTMSWHSHSAVKGAGISAMPSMHVATATIILLASWGSRLRWLAGLFWAMTLFGSVYLGYHYLVDAPIAVAIAVLCWFASLRWYARQGHGPAQPSILQLAHGVDGN